jgi:hypothetical protein
MFKKAVRDRIRLESNETAKMLLSDKAEVIPRQRHASTAVKGHVAVCVISINLRQDVVFQNPDAKGASSKMDTMSATAVSFMDSYVPEQMPVNAFQLYGNGGSRPS